MLHSRGRQRITEAGLQREILLPTWRRPVQTLCTHGCAKLDPVCKWPEKGLYCGLLQCVEDGRPFILMMGAFMGAAVAAGGGVAKLHAALLCFVN